MFNWEGCPLELFDQYMDVAAVKAAESGENFVSIEVWIPDRYAKEHRPECQDFARRPIYGVVKQIRKLCGDRKAILLFMGDDELSPYRIDAVSWSVALAPLLAELRRNDLLKGSILFTAKPHEEVLQYLDRNFPRQSQRDACSTLFDQLDLLITGQANRYVCAENREIHGIPPKGFPAP